MVHAGLSQQLDHWKVSTTTIRANFSNSHSNSWWTVPPKKIMEMKVAMEVICPMLSGTSSIMASLLVINTHTLERLRSVITLMP